MHWTGTTYSSSASRRQAFHFISTAVLDSTYEIGSLENLALDFRTKRKKTFFEC